MTEKEKDITLKISQKIRRKDPSAEIILFGSHARGQAGKESDWDILILLNSEQVNRAKEREFRDELLDVELETGEPISTFVFSKSEWEQKHLFTPFYQEIKKDGISI